jgi:predicted amidophosphoribosyltransferase
MEWQQIINLAFGVTLPVAGWFFRQLWDAVQKLKDDIKKIEIDLPTSYVKKTELESQYNKIEAMLEKIWDRLDQKVDK